MIIRTLVILTLSIFNFFQLSLPKEFSIRKNESNDKASANQKLSETTIRNNTQKVIQYVIQQDRPGEKPVKKVIKAGNTDHYPGDVALNLTFYRDGKPLLYRLNPGGTYSFRLDDYNGLDVYADTNKKADMEDAVPFVATPMDVVRKMLELACVDKHDIVYDLGCGDGRIVILAAGELGAQGVGIDIDNRRIKESRANAKASGVEDKVEFRLQDVLKADFSEATVVALYMLTEINELLRPQLEKQLRGGTYVVTHSYPVPGWASKMIDFVVMMAEDGEEHLIYLYQK